MARTKQTAKLSTGGQPPRKYAMTKARKRRDQRAPRQKKRTGVRIQRDHSM